MGYLEHVHLDFILSSYHHRYKYTVRIYKLLAIILQYDGCICLV